MCANSLGCRKLAEQVELQQQQIKDLQDSQKELEETIKHLNFVIQRQTEISNQKINAIESKYKTIRLINSTLEVPLFFLFITNFASPSTFRKLAWSSEQIMKKNCRIKQKTENVKYKSQTFKPFLFFK